MDLRALDGASRSGTSVKNEGREEGKTEAKAEARCFDINHHTNRFLNPKP